MPDPTLDPGALGVLLETVGDDREFLGELIETYLSDCPGLFAQLRDRLAARDAPGVRRAAHTLKSTSATFGAVRLAAIAREVETAAADDDLTGADRRIDAAQAEFDLVRGPLQATVDAGVPS